MALVHSDVSGAGDEGMAWLDAVAVVRQHAPWANPQAMLALMLSEGHLYTVEQE